MATFVMLVLECFRAAAVPPFGTAVGVSLWCASITGLVFMLVKYLNACKHGCRVGMSYMDYRFGLS